ncbi:MULTISPECIES: ShlB/FhaC/HecB family hemolysin secretion/activation protein [unclassified Synechocystis]|uniref:ShlB/FhaC/HecB family hemolysin secretion/activation protein n=1 Tax=unclassified Synechocystis TaxID=2640012 RepID=UPI000410585C|nr:MULTISPECIES: ShlB/FhaC/HecB family hemolysin secretion/activation protein [unclassified Synechocystis]AIE74041.1 hypothetical protein D082_15130 [Synechocystis sp. PCC 6714]
MLSCRYALQLTLCFSLPLLMGGRALAENLSITSPLALNVIEQSGDPGALSQKGFFLSQGQVPTPPVQPLPSEDDVDLSPSSPPLNLGTESAPSQDEAVDTCGFSPSALAAGATIPLLKASVDGTPVEVNLLGMTVFSASELLTLPALQPWQTAPPSTKALLTIAPDLTAAEFEVLYQGLVDGITQLYINRGYITSQAIAKPMEPNQNPESGFIQQPIQVVEGQVESIQVRGRGRLRPAYICDRVARGVRSPVNVGELEESLRLLQINPMLKKVQGSLLPTGKVGLSNLSVTVEEAFPFSANLSFDNYSPISLGSERVGINLDYKNLTGLGDRLSGSYYVSTTGGLDILDFNYRVPLNPTDGTLQLRFVPTWTRITQSPFDVFNITGSNPLYEISYRQPLWTSLTDEFALSFGFRYQDGRTLGLNRPDLTNISRTSVFQFGQDYTLRDPGGLWFFRSQMNLGTGLFDATTNPSPQPSGEFFSWLGQAQRLQRLDDNNLLIVQADLQLTPDSLLPDYLFIIGGGQSLRGYRQNARSADNGIRLSVENRITLARDGENRSVFELAPFVDFGAVWNSAGNPTQLPPNSVLVGPGLGIIWRDILGMTGLSFRFDYGIPVVKLDNLTGNWQNDGLYFQLNYRPPFGQ